MPNIWRPNAPGRHASPGREEVMPHHHTIDIQHFECSVIEFGGIRTLQQEQGVMIRWRICSRSGAANLTCEISSILIVLMVLPHEMLTLVRDNASVIEPNTSIYRGSKPRESRCCISCRSCRLAAESVSFCNIQGFHGDGCAALTSSPITVTRCMIRSPTKSLSTKC
jgi:hypothetical protein